VADPSRTCEFCKIVRGELPAEIICEGDRWIAFFPLKPATPGHTLVIPREHFADLWDLDDPSLAGDLMNATIRVGRAVQAALTPDGMNLVTSAGKTAEQSVFHLHLHVVPRWEEDGFGKIWPTGEQYDIDELDDLADRIRSHC
jgi:histidine triad (HIT) family protein